MMKLAGNLYPICRSITGNGIMQSLGIIKQNIPLNIQTIPTGTKVFDWTIPQEWNIRSAWIADLCGNRVVDFNNHNLHIVNYSEPVNQYITNPDLQKHLYSLPEQPDAIPYATSYYSKSWGFCVTEHQRRAMKDKVYHVFIDSQFSDGVMPYGELVIEGNEKKEVFFSTYLCHPSMANNELSGPCVAVELARWLMQSRRRYTYRFVFIPETIGSLAYMSRNLAEMQRNIIAGFNLTCMGDNGPFSYLPTRCGDTLSDKAALAVLRQMYPDFRRYTFIDRGSDERQYCSPGADLPVATVARSLYGQYPEYHTSLDNLDFISEDSLGESLYVMKSIIEVIESNCAPSSVHTGEPQLSKRRMYPGIGIKTDMHSADDLLNVLAYADGNNDLIGISNITSIPVNKVVKICRNLREMKLIQ